MKKPRHLFRAVWKLGAFIVAASLCAAPTAQAQTATPVQKKFIASGWGEPDTVNFKKYLDVIEQTPFNGIVIDARGKSDDGKTVRLKSAFTVDPWKKEWFQNSVDDLKAIHSTKLTDNFIHLGANPGNVDWFDDAGWKEIVNHWRIAAWIAKEGNLKGILFDPEPYVKPYKQFQYILQADNANHTLEEYQAKARQRGREIIAAVAEVDPNLIIFTYYMNSVQADALGSSNPAMALRNSSYNLYPAFINGWLDAAPPTMIFIDGCEKAYRFNSEIEYLNAANLMRNTARSLVAPENRAKYEAQAQTSFGMYMDANVNPPGNRHYIEPKGTSRTERLKINSMYAAKAATEYLWFYGEHYRWWPTANKQISPESWEDKLPGITEALWTVSHPQQATERAIAAAAKNGARNLLLNANFAKGPAAATSAEKVMDWKTAGMPADWRNWQQDYSHGTFSFDPKITHIDDGSGSVRVAGVAGGTVIQSVAVKPGEKYIMQAWTRHAGRGTSSVTVRWNTPDKKWSNEDDDVTMYNSEIPEQDKWQKIQGMATAPDGVGYLVLLLSQSNQPTDNDVAWYDDISVRQIK